MLPAPTSPCRAARWPATELWLTAGSVSGVTAPDPGSCASRALEGSAEAEQAGATFSEGLEAYARGREVLGQQRPLDQPAVDGADDIGAGAGDVEHGALAQPDGTGTSLTTRLRGEAEVAEQVEDLGLDPRWLVVAVVALASVVSDGMPSAGVRPAEGARSLRVAVAGRNDMRRDPQPLPRRPMSPATSSLRSMTKSASTAASEHFARQTTA